MLFTVIFEFQIKRKNFHDVREWAEEWYALKDLPLGTTRYNKAPPEDHGPVRRRRYGRGVASQPECSLAVAYK